MRLIIHLDNCVDKQKALLRVYLALPEYYRLKGENDRRLTVRFDGPTMAIYHDRTDVTLFSRGVMKGLKDGR